MMGLGCHTLISSYQEIVGNLRALSSHQKILSLSASQIELNYEILPPTASTSLRVGSSFIKNYYYYYYYY